jgi:8-oxo-dGTP pyrophosphatase MutT (NUDIX family)
MDKQFGRGRIAGEIIKREKMSVNAGIMSSSAANKTDSYEILDEADFLLPENPRTETNRRSRNFIRLAQLRKLRECEQAAAVCYRVRNGEIEFLLVQTGSGRWTFPKGSAEPGLTHAQAAALEAYEEAGVHGRIEEAAFTRYLYAKRTRKASAKLAVSAHLCEVSRLEAPEESHRNPTWFGADEAKGNFRNEVANGAELVRVINGAVRRIRGARDEKRTKPVTPRKAQVIEINYLQRSTERALPPRF